MCIVQHPRSTRFEIRMWSMRVLIIAIKSLLQIVESYHRFDMNLLQLSAQGKGPKTQTQELIEFEDVPTKNN